MIQHTDPEAANGCEDLKLLVAEPFWQKIKLAVLFDGFLILHQDPGRYASKPLKLVLQLKESIALEGVAVFFHAFSKGSPTGGLFPCRSSQVPGFVIAASQPVTCNAAQQGSNRADNDGPGCGIHERRH